MASASTSRHADIALVAPAPVAPTERIAGIDELRGLALFGVLTINIVFEFRVSIFEQFLPPNTAEPAVDRALRHFLAAAIELKTLALFSLNAAVMLATAAGRNRIWRTPGSISPDGYLPP